MELVLAIIDKGVWPATAIVIALIFRRAINELLAALRKLRYKDLELHFEREALEMRATAERDIPNVERSSTNEEADHSGSRKDKNDTGIRYSRPSPRPPIERIFQAWILIEEETKALMVRHGIPSEANETIRAKAIKLQEAGVLNDASAEALLDIAAFRNKVAHADHKSLTVEVADSVEFTARRLKAYFEIL